jgi:hypothetical protein
MPDEFTSELRSSGINGLTPHPDLKMIALDGPR